MTTKKWIATLAVVGLLLPLSTGCATKSDVEGLEGQLRDLQVRQDSMYQRLARLSLAVRDSVAIQSEAFYQLRGDITTTMVEIQDQLITLQELTGQSQRNLASLRDQLEDQRRTLTEPGEGSGMQPGGGEATELYNAAVTQFNRGSFQTARQGFQRFLEAYPNHRLAPDAQFYLADILAQEDRLDEAMEAFERIGELWPTSSKVPDALYRLGVLELEMGNEDRARTYLERVVNSYPDAPVTVLARERLEEIGGGA